MRQQVTASHGFVFPKIRSRLKQRRKTRVSLIGLIRQILPIEWLSRRSPNFNRSVACNNQATDQRVCEDSEVLTKEDKIELYSRQFDRYS